LQGISNLSEVIKSNSNIRCGMMKTVQNFIKKAGQTAVVAESMLNKRDYFEECEV
jgi:hypothetical protein